MEKELNFYTEEERNKAIKREYRRLKKISKVLNDDNKIVLDRLFREAAFMAVTLEEARLMIAREGILEEYQNGANQWGRKKSSFVEVYDKMANTYSKIIKQICDALPETVAADISKNELYEFISKK